MATDLDLVVGPAVELDEAVGVDPHHVACCVDPSEAGSILLDDPMTKNSDDRLENELVFIATFGAHGESRLGKRMNARVGIVGHVYATGVAYMTDDVVDDPFFYPTLDLSDGFSTTTKSDP